MECLETEESRFVSVQQRKQLEDGFAEAINRGDFTTFFQPKVETDTLRIVGAEAIARLEYCGKKIPPAEFVSILERNGMVCVLDFYILEQVCKDIREWLKKGLEPV